MARSERRWRSLPACWRTRIAGFLVRRFKLDESLDRLAEVFPQGCDIDTVTDEMLRGASDREVAQAGAREGRVLVVADKRFHEHLAAGHPGAIILRPHILAVPELAQLLRRFLSEAPADLNGRIAVVEPHRTRYVTWPRT